MYHPELYPELAKHNIKAEPLQINRDIKIQAKKQETKIKKELKAADKEIRVVDKLKIDVKDKNTPSLRNAILRSWKTSNAINPEQHSSKFDVDPIFNEMYKLANLYMFPNIQVNNEKLMDTMKYALAAHEKDLNPLPVGLIPDEEDAFSLEDFVERDSTSHNTYSSLVELYAKYIKDNQKVELRDLMIKMKREQMMSPDIDIRSVPLESFTQEEKIYFDEKIAEKVELEDLVAKLDSTPEEDIKKLFTTYQVESKEELRNKVDEAISRLDSEITMKYLKFGENIEENSLETSQESNQA
jgi:hypothetical protein